MLTERLQRVHRTALAVGGSAGRRLGLLVERGEVESDEVALVAYDETCTGRTFGRNGVIDWYAASV